MGRGQRTRARFACSSVKKFRHWNRREEFLYEAEFVAVTGGSAENESFFAATPSGSIKLSTVRDNLFEPGQEYYVDFLEVPPAEASAGPEGA